MTTPPYPPPLSPGGSMPLEVRWPPTVAVRVFGAEAPVADGFVVDWQLAVAEDQR